MSVRIAPLLWLLLASSLPHPSLLTQPSLLHPSLTQPSLNQEQQERVGEEGSGHEQTLEGLEEDNKKLRGQLLGAEECKEKQKTLEEQNIILRTQVDQETPGLEKLQKDTMDKLMEVQADAARWRLLLKLVLGALVLTEGSTVLTSGKAFFGFIKEKLSKLLARQSQDQTTNLVDKRKRR